MGRNEDFDSAFQAALGRKEINAFSASSTKITPKKKKKQCKQDVEHKHIKAKETKHLFNFFLFQLQRKMESERKREREHKYLLFLCFRFRFSSTYTQNTSQHTESTKLVGTFFPAAVFFESSHDVYAFQLFA